MACVRAVPRATPPLLAMATACAAELSATSAHMDTAPSPIEPLLTKARNSASAELNVCIDSVADVTLSTRLPRNRKQVEVDFPVSRHPAKFLSVYTETSCTQLSARTPPGAWNANLMHPSRLVHLPLRCYLCLR
eukprot:1546941-Amphidinium_carterae.1